MPGPVRLAGTTSVVPDCASLAELLHVFLADCAAAWPDAAAIGERNTHLAQPFRRCVVATARGGLRLTPRPRDPVVAYWLRDCLFTRCLSPPAAFDLAKRSPSEVNTTARLLALGAHLLLHLADNTSFGGVMFLIS